MHVRIYDVCSRVHRLFSFFSLSQVLFCSQLVTSLHRARFHSRDLIVISAKFCIPFLSAFAGRGCTNSRNSGESARETRVLEPRDSSMDRFLKFAR